MIRCVCVCLDSESDASRLALIRSVSACVAACESCVVRRRCLPVVQQLRQTHTQLFLAFDWLPGCTGPSSVS